MAEQVTKRMTAAEFQQLPQSNQPTELINGALIVSPSPVSNHQRITGRIYAMLLNLSTGEPIVSPMDVYLDDTNVFQPDVFWLAEDSPCVERDGYFYGAPELVVEVHFPATAKQDKQEKFDAYEQHGVQEYWMVDPIASFIEVWQRKENQFTRLGVFGGDDEFVSAALNQTIGLSGIFPAT